MSEYRSKRRELTLPRQSSSLRSRVRIAAAAAPLVYSRRLKASYGYRRTLAGCRCACRRRTTPAPPAAPSTRPAKTPCPCANRRRTAGSSSARRRTTSSSCRPRHRPQAEPVRRSQAVHSCCRSSRFGRKPGLAASFRELAHAQNVALPLGDGNHPARIEQIEHMARLDALVVGRQRHQVALAVADRHPTGLDVFAAGRLRHPELLEQHLGFGKFEVVPRIFLLGLQEDVAVGDLLLTLAAVEVEIEDAVDALHIHRESLETVGQLPRDRRAFEARDLLKIRELRHLHAVAPALPAESPGTEGRAFPVVLDEADIVELGIDADRGERFEVELLDVVG